LQDTKVQMPVEQVVDALGKLHGMLHPLQSVMVLKD